MLFERSVDPNIGADDPNHAETNLAPQGSASPNLCPFALFDLAVVDVDIHSQLVTSRKREAITRSSDPAMENLWSSGFIQDFSTNARTQRKKEGRLFLGYRIGHKLDACRHRGGSASPARIVPRSWRLHL